MAFLDRFNIVRYNGVRYDNYPSSISEIAGHLDKECIEDAANYSLHTEYSYGKRKFDSILISYFPALCSANKDGVPQLWYSNEWAKEFAEFIIELTKNHESPTVIEIHPPFNDYCDMESFFIRYSIFEQLIHKTYPNAEIVIENRSGSVYRGGKFILGKAKDIASFCDRILTENILLGLVLDFPQLLTAENINTIKFDSDKYSKIIETIAPYRNLIKGIHIWGKKKSNSARWVAHCGDLNTYFDNDTESKQEFIHGIKTICNDSTIRYLVPEVNSGVNDILSVLNDLNAIL